MIILASASFGHLDTTIEGERDIKWWAWLPISIVIKFIFTTRSLINVVEFLSDLLKDRQVFRALGHRCARWYRCCPPITSLKFLHIP